MFPRGLFHVRQLHGKYYLANPLQSVKGIVGNYLNLEAQQLANNPISVLNPKVFDLLRDLCGKIAFTLKATLAPT